MARAAKPKPDKALEQKLWETADKLRGNQEPSEYMNRPGSDGDSFYWIPTKVWSVRFVA